MGLKDSSKLILPNDNTIENTLIGTGGGYGESLILHLGNQNWIVIDSCKDPKRNVCLPLEYLNSIGVNVENDVKLIVCTHWHDDHIKGISEILECAKNAVFSIAKTSDRRKFLRLIGLDYNKIQSDSSATSTIELNRCITLIDKRKSEIRTASTDRVLFSLNDTGLKCEVFALSPSDFIMNEFNKEISTLMKDFGNPNKKIIFQSPNDKSVALFIKINEQRILLGSDLEISGNHKKGWHCILNNSQCIDKKSSLFKIPHHGSKNGYDQKIWNNLILKDAVAKLTPYNRGTKLPKKDMLQTFLTHTPNLYSTSLNFDKNKPKKREKSLSKAIQKFNPSLSEIKYNKGIVQCRTHINSMDIDWKINLIDEAKHITLAEIDKL